MEWMTPILCLTWSGQQVFLASINRWHRCFALLFYDKILICKVIFSLKGNSKLCYVIFHSRYKNNSSLSMKIILNVYLTLF
jgi:hypothetical protein